MIDQAADFEAQGRAHSARESYFIASLLYSAARWPEFETNPKVVHYNDRMNHCYTRFAALMNRPIERVEIPFGDKFIPGWLHLPHAPKPGEKFPCAIGLDGMDASKEIMCSLHGDKFLDRGMAHFIYDGPGQGECPIRELFVTPTNHKDAALAVYDYLAKHPAIDTDRMVLGGPVKMTTTTGYALQTSALSLDLKARRAFGDGGVTGQLTTGPFSADSISADLEARTVTLDGHVHLTMTPGRRLKAP